MKLIKTSILLVFCLTLMSCNKVVLHSDVRQIEGRSMKEQKMEQTSEKISMLFAKVKTVCVGRYLLVVPQDATVSYGLTQIDFMPNAIYPNRAKETQTLEAEGWQRLKENNKSARLIRHGAGVIKGSWSMSYYEDDITEQMGNGAVSLTIPVGANAFLYGREFQDRSALAKFPNAQELQDEANKNHIPRNEQDAMSVLVDWARKTRPRSDDEVPPDSGFCVPYGFIQDSTYQYRENIQVGIRFPSLPDVNFSISSENYSNITGEDGWGILKRVKKQQTLSGDEYDGHFLRIGKAPLKSWVNGEEVLAKVKSTGGLDFTWNQVGTNGSVANPNDLTIKMYTKVKGETIGASETTSLTDDEAIALWDKLLKGFGFRVPIQAAFQSSVGVGAPCPQTGMWYCEGVSPEQGIYMRKGDPMPGQSYNKEARANMQWHLIKPMGDDT